MVTKYGYRCYQCGKVVIVAKPPKICQQCGCTKFRQTMTFHNVKFGTNKNRLPTIIRPRSNKE